MRDRLIVTITIRKSKRPTFERTYVMTSDHPMIEVGCSESGWERGLHAVRGACLHAIGDWPEVPSRIDFTAIRQDI